MGIMNSIKALLFGFFYVVILGLIIQLVFIFLAMGYTELLKDYPTVEMVARIVSYIIGITVYFLLMATAGFLTASIAKKNTTLHGIIISVSSIGLSLLSSINEDEFTWISLIFFILGVTFTLMGTRRWQQSQAVSS